MDSITVPIEKGYYEFKLAKVLSDRKISINKLIRETYTDFKVIKRMMNGTMVRIDITVLARFCDYLDCDVSDIFEYHRKKSQE